MLEGPRMVKPNYSFEKRQRELAKKKKKEEKMAERAARKTTGGGSDMPDEPAEGDAPADEQNPAQGLPPP